MPSIATKCERKFVLLVELDRRLYWTSINMQNYQNILKYNFDRFFKSFFFFLYALYMLVEETVHTTFRKEHGEIPVKWSGRETCGETGKWCRPSLFTIKTLTCHPKEEEGSVDKTVESQPRGSRVEPGIGNGIRWNCFCNGWYRY